MAEYRGKQVLNMNKPSPPGTLPTTRRPGLQEFGKPAAKYAVLRSLQIRVGFEHSSGHLPSSRCKGGIGDMGDPQLRQATLTGTEKITRTSETKVLFG